MKTALVSLLPREERANALGLGYLKAYAESQPDLGAVELSIVDESMEDDLDALARRLEAAGADAAGLHCQLCNEEAVVRLAALLRARIPGIHLVLGGQEASLHPERLLRRTGAEAVVVGEGEETFAGVLRAWLGRGALEDVAGLVLRRGRRTLRTAGRTPIRDLKTLPSPYLSGPLPQAWAGMGRAAIETTRGCPYACAFCSWPNGVRPRHFPLERVAAELRAILRMDPRTLVHFADPDLFLHRERAAAVLRAIRAADPRQEARFWFNAYFGNIDAKLAGLCDHRGFILEGGVQSVNPKALRAAGRRFDEAAVRRGVDLLKRKAPKARLSIQLILGLPGDDLRGYRRSLEWMSALDVPEAQVFPMQLFPGTEFHRRRRELGIRADAEPPYSVRSTRTFSAAELRDGRRTALRLSFFRRHPAAWDALRRGGGPLWAAASSLSDFLEARGIPMERSLAEWERGALQYLTPLAAGPDPVPAERVAEGARAWLAANARGGVARRCRVRTTTALGKQTPRRTDGHY
ncbi:MAG: hypothetical protein A2X36_16785 [Elusimicrobia bacterium GWA2_69_24]|nr:MAG: hypothetical protein A2X36_16785 [Elusimicrobia bacterium GWA2_69_24]HBL16629.1 hypothetical protein [Elusimicrobiota bacterium]